MSRAVCRNCWTWYSKREAACPHCHIPLTAADAGARSSGVDSPVAPPPPPTAMPLPSLPPSTADAPFPAAAASASPGLSGLQWLLIGGGALAVIVVIGLIVIGLLVTGALGPVTSSDGTFSVTVPRGWAQGHASTAAAGKTVLALARLQQTNGVESHFIVSDAGQFVSLSALEAGWQQYVESGKFPVAGTVGSATRTTLAGAPALTVDFQGSKIAGQILFVDYGRKTYVIEMSSDPTEFKQLAGSDFAAILTSWQWR